MMVKFICCSKAEGFGHFIQEAKASSSVVLTTGGPPMNEFVSNDDGFLIKYLKK